MLQGFRTPANGLGLGGGLFHGQFWNNWNIVEIGVKYSPPPQVWIEQTGPTYT